MSDVYNIAIRCAHGEQSQVVAAARWSEDGFDEETGEALSGPEHGHWNIGGRKGGSVTAPPRRQVLERSGGRRPRRWDLEDATEIQSTRDRYAIACAQCNQRVVITRDRATKILDAVRRAGKDYVFLSTFRVNL